MTMQVRDIPVDREGMETTKHGSFSFPIAIYHSIMSKNVLGYTPWHWHTEMQFCLVTSGQIQFSVNEKQYQIQEGNGIFVNSGYLHMAKPVQNPDSSYICLDADPKLLSSFKGSIFEEKYVTPFLKDPALEDVLLSVGIPWQREVLDRIVLAYELFEKKEFGYELQVSAVLGEMWLLLLENRPEGISVFHSRQQENLVVQNILSFISQNFGRHISISDISKAVSFSGSECCRIFKRVTGDTIFSYLRDYRLARSAELLRNTKLPVSQIAYDTGFCSTSYFIEQFKAQMKTTPLQYRKQSE